MAHIFKDTQIDGNLNVTEDIQIGDESINEIILNNINQKLNVILGTQYSLAVSYENDSNWTINSASCVLAGTNLRFAFNATRSSATGAGNITNENIGTLTFEHGGKITGFYQVGFTTASYAGPCNLYIDNATLNNSANTGSFRIVLAGTHAATQQLNAYFAIPVRIDANAY